MSPKPTFSIIIPVYNVEEYLPECLDSLLAQSYGNFEVLAVDDGSTDGSLAILERVAANDARFRIIRQQNAGPSVARNVGVANATGEYCLFVDSDDAAHPQLLEICHHVLHKHQADFVSYNYASVPPHTKLPTSNYKLTSLRYHVSNNPYHLLNQRHPNRIALMTHSTCYRTELAQKHPFIKGIIYEDYPHTVCILQDVKTAITLQYKLYGYTKRPTSLMHSHFTAKNIQYYRTGLLCIADAYRGNPSAMNVIARTIFPEYYKQMANAIFRAKASTSERLDMLLTFRALLQELNARGLLRWRGHKLRRYFAYRRLLRANETELNSLLPRLSKIFH